eukprot:scaffold51722_cov63-Phaeocystis_antarctica.AAC.3
MVQRPKPQRVLLFTTALGIPEKREHVLVLMYRRGNRLWLQLALVAARQHRALVLPVGLERARTFSQQLGVCGLQPLRRDAAAFERRKQRREPAREDPRVCEARAARGAAPGRACTCARAPPRWRAHRRRRSGCARPPAAPRAAFAAPRLRPVRRGASSQTSGIPRRECRGGGAGGAPRATATRLVRVEVGAGAGARAGVRRRCPQARVPQLQPAESGVAAVAGLARHSSPQAA